MKNKNLSKEDLQTLLGVKKDSIKRLVNEVKFCKKITLSLTLNGEYMISTHRKKLTPSSQANIEHWYYSHSVKVDPDIAKSKTAASTLTKSLIDGIKGNIDRTTWYT